MSPDVGDGDRAPVVCWDEGQPDPAGRERQGSAARVPGIHHEPGIQVSVNQQ